MAGVTRPGGAVGDVIVVVPSISFPVVELQKIAAVQSYEERMLFLLLLLADPAVRIVYVTSEEVDPATIDYYLRFLPDPADARRRLALLSVGDPSIGSLSAKLLARPDDLDRLRAAIGDVEAGAAGMLPFNVTRAEHDLADALGLQLYGPRPDLVWLGSKSGSRQVALEAGVPVLAGTEDLTSLADLAKAVARLRETRPDAPAVVVKLNNGFSGQGNAIVELDGLADPITASPTVFCAGEESWPSFEAKIEDEGAIVEELVRAPNLRSPSVQLQISPSGEYEVLSTHDQILGGPDNQVYIGCRFPARPEYRMAIQAEARKVAEVMVARGVIGVFGIDFLVDQDRVTLSEINLRMGGTTHPFWMARLATGGTYDQESGELRVPGGGVRCYVATDNIKSLRLLGSQPAHVIARIDEAGLAFDPATGCGVTLHLLGALPGAGKMGVVCIAETPEAADDLYVRVLEALDAP
ncbi:MAG: hypothetical protein QOG82_1757 [Actinomycetota bacterium]|jgi:hypothetical protein|nr:hypothetical protein [Actinomycetota bacterium]